MLKMHAINGLTIVNAFKLRYRIIGGASPITDNEISN